MTLDMDRRSWRSGTLYLCLLAFTLSSWSFVYSCPDADNVIMPCVVLPFDGLQCTYVKGIPQNIQVVQDPNSLDYPAPVESLDVEIFSNIAECQQQLNITWVPSYYGLSFLKGFLLNITFNYDGDPYNILRTFNVTVERWTSQNAETVFRHECIVPAVNITYRIRLHSVPMIPANRSIQNYKELIYHTAVQGSPSPCVAVNSDYNFNWTAIMWTLEDPSNNSVEVCFYTAPPILKLFTYDISLLYYPGTKLNVPVDEYQITVDNTQVTKQCLLFANICSGIYKIWVQPVSVMGSCTCHVGPSLDDCRDSCTATEVLPIDMTTSNCNPTSPTNRPFPPTTTSGLVQAQKGVLGSGSQLDDGAIAGIVIALALAAAVAVLLFVYRYRKKRSRDDLLHGCPGDDPLQSPAPGIVQFDDAQPVLIVYSHDNERHHDVVRKFAAFLHAQCRCDVRYDEWSQVEISQTNALDWLMKQMRQVTNIVIVSSEGSFHQRQAWLDGNRWEPAKEAILTDMFLPAIRQIQNEFYVNGSQTATRFHRVYFPYTDQKFAIDLEFGKEYRMMRHVEELFLHIHGRSKYSCRGMTTADLINHDKYVGCEEGRNLSAAIDAATAYIRDNPNWFQERYRCRALIDRKRFEPLASRRGEDDDETGDADSLVSIDDERRIHRLETNGSDSSGVGHLSNFDGGGLPSPGGYVSFQAPSISSVSSSGLGLGVSRDECHHRDISVQSPSSLSGPALREIVFKPPNLHDKDDDGSSINSVLFTAHMLELNEQFDSGFGASSSSAEFKSSNC